MALYFFPAKFEIRVLLLEKKMTTESVLSGLVGFLERQPDVKNINLVQGSPISISELRSWEKKHDCSMPKDLEQFYLANNGVCLEWSYQYNDAVLKLGCVNVNGLFELKPLHISQSSRNSERRDDAIKSLLLDMDRGNSFVHTTGGPWKPLFGSYCKIFSLNYCPTCGHICLVCDTRAQEDDEKYSIWLLDLSYSWHYLSPSFSDMLRQAIVHLGLFQWPYVFTPYGLSPHYERWLHMFIPRRLEQDMKHQQHQQHHFKTTTTTTTTTTTVPTQQEDDHTPALASSNGNSNQQQNRSNWQKATSSSTTAYSAASINHFDSSKVLDLKTLREKKMKSEVNTPVKKPSQTKS